MSNAPEPRRADATKKPKSPEPESSEKSGPGKKPVAVPGRVGPRPGKKLNGTEDAARPTSSARHQVSLAFYYYFKLNLRFL